MKILSLISIFTLLTLGVLFNIDASGIGTTVLNPTYTVHNPVGSNWEVRSGKIETEGNSNLFYHWDPYWIDYLKDFSDPTGPGHSIVFYDSEELYVASVVPFINTDKDNLFGGINISIPTNATYFQFYGSINDVVPGSTNPDTYNISLNSHYHLSNIPISNHYWEYTLSEGSGFEYIRFFTPSSNIGGVILDNVSGIEDTHRIEMFVKGGFSLKVSHGTARPWYHILTEPGSNAFTFRYDEGYTWDDPDNQAWILRSTVLGGTKLPDWTLISMDFADQSYKMDGIEIDPGFVTIGSVRPPDGPDRMPPTMFDPLVHNIRILLGGNGSSPLGWHQEIRYINFYDVNDDLIFEITPDVILDGTLLNSINIEGPFLEGDLPTLTIVPTDPFYGPTDPEDPVDPEDPEDPVDPEDPEDPVDPEVPEGSGDFSDGYVSGYAVGYDAGLSLPDVDFYTLYHNLPIPGIEIHLSNGNIYFSTSLYEDIWLNGVTYGTSHGDYSGAYEAGLSEGQAQAAEETLTTLLASTLSVVAVFFYRITTEVSLFGITPLTVIMTIISGSIVIFAVKWVL